MKRNKMLLILSFIIPITVIGLVYAVTGMYPFGEKSLLINDMSSQYVELIQYFREALSGKKSFVYSFNLGMGRGIIGIIAFVLSSPVNILLVFFPKMDIQIVILLLTLIKFGLAGLSFSFYLNRRFNKINYATVLFSLCYSMMAYNISNALNIMWLDGVILLPIILNYLTVFIKKNEKAGLGISVVVLIISNFYIAYIVILFSIIYFWYEIFNDGDSINFKKATLKFLKFIGLITVSGMISAFLTLPTYLSLVRENTVKSVFTFNINYKFGEVSAKLFIGSFDTFRTFGKPNLYCGIVIIILAIGYFFSNQISKRKKITAFSMLFIMYLSLKVEFLYMIWHALDRPHWFPARFSFTICFFLICIAYEFYLITEKKINERKCLKLLTVIVSILAAYIIFIKNKYISLSDIKINLVVMTAYIVIFSLKEKKKIQKLLLCIVIIGETFINGLLIQYDLDKEIGYKYRNDYVYEKKEIKKALDIIKSKDKGIYRIEQDFSPRYNNGLGNGYMALNVYHSIYNMDLHNFLRHLGLSFFNKYGRYDGTTVVSDTLLGVKYIISENENNVYPLFAQSEAYDIYVNDNAFPLVFPVDREISEISSYKKYKNPFELQTDIISKISGKEVKLFEEIDIVSEKTENLKISEVEKGKVKYEKINNSEEAYLEYIVKQKNNNNQTYLYIDNLKEIVSKIYLKINDTDVSGDTIDQGTELLKVNNDDKIKIVSDTDLLILNKNKLYELNREQFENVIKEIKKHNLIERIKDGYVKIKYNNDENKILMTTIPYEKGWSAKINRKQEKIEKIMGIFIGIKPVKGKNTIELKYEAPGLKSGIIISLMGILLLVFIQYKKINIKKLRR